jgi:aerobic carbon-monoxide dehydrogenase large subunit
MGDSRLRKEDARFIQGKGNYVDDIKLPGMLHMDIVRSPLAHARIKGIDKSEGARRCPACIAVLTADDLKPLKLHWMPTLAGDVQAVLADEKVHFQMQEVAVVIADDRYAAADGVEAVQVDYEELPVVIDPYEALQPDAPVLREDLAGKTSGAHGPREHHNHIFTWDAGDKAAADAVFANAPVKVSQHMHYPRVHPCPLETCGCVASFDPVRGELTTYITSQAPHVVRTVVSLLSGIPEARCASSAPTSAAASATRSASTRAMSAPSSPASCWASRSSGSRTASRTSAPPPSPATTTWTARSPPPPTARSPRCA